ncbi:MAG: FAD-dependent oxidoreductase, partial [Polaribacter sp.]|nr:FAD-dependent oxidoreductase [Polaribacter sp.]
MSKKVVVIGGGIIGLCSAYYLQKEGHEVTVIDKSDFTSGASYVNAGYLTPSHIISLAAPGMITKGIKWMFNSESPFYVKPRLDSEFLKWSLAFKKSANAKKVENSIPVIRDINLLSRDLYEDLKASKEFDFHYERKGLLMAYQTDKVGEAEWEVGERLIEAGLNAEMLTKEEIKKREPNANLNVKGGVFYDCDGHTTPSDFMPKMVEHLKNLGVEILAKEEVKDIEISNKIISKIITNKREIVADEVVLSA